MANAGPQPPPSVDPTGAVLPCRHRPRHCVRLCLSDADRDGIWLRGLRRVARPADARAVACLVLSRHGDPGRCDGTCNRRRGKGKRPLYVLSTAARQPLLLSWHSDRSRRLLDLDRTHGLACPTLEGRSPGPPHPACDVCHDRWRAALGLDVTRSMCRDRVPDSAECLRLDSHDRSRIGPAAVFVDPSWHCVFLADTRLYRIL